MKTIILTGGGTAGHIMPNIALLSELRLHYQNIIYIGAKNSLEEQIISKYDFITFFGITTTKLKRKFDFSNLLIPFKLIKGVSEARKIIKKTKPNVIFSKGGYVSVPVVIAGHECKIPIVSHESDLSLGLANKITAKYSKVICTSFLVTSTKINNGVYTGSPIRKELTNGNKQNIINQYNIISKKPKLLIIGGSLGASTINLQVRNQLKNLTKSFFILHITGKGKLDNSIKNKNYIQVEFSDKIQDYFDIADVVLSRAGSNVIYELLTLKKPMLLCPLPKDESRGDQIENAEYFRKKGYCEVINQSQLTHLLLPKLKQTYLNTDIYIKNMKEAHINGNRKIINQILKYEKK